MTETEALRWILDIIQQFGSGPHPFASWSEASGTRKVYNCHGCSAEFISEWPSWPTPTLRTFPHAPGCRYVAAMKAAQWTDERDTDR